MLMVFGTTNIMFNLLVLVNFFLAITNFEFLQAKYTNLDLITHFENSIR